MRPDVIVVGAGAAGIMAAWRASQLGARVLLLEKTGRIGTKILISGGGKCNIAHAGPIEELLSVFRKNEARFIRSAVYRWPNSSIIDLFTSRGLEVTTRPDGRVFPVKQTAKDVVAILREYLFESGVELALNTPVTGLLTEENRVVGVQTGAAYDRGRGFKPRAEPVARYGAKALLHEVLLNETSREQGLGELQIRCENVVVTTGGSSYPNSGTTGDGWAWLRALGHRIERVHAALAPIYLRPEPFNPDLAGLALRDIVLKARSNGKEIATWRGDMLWTHHGISGPTVLGISRRVEESLTEHPVRIAVDCAPQRSSSQLLEEFLSLSPRQLVRTWLGELLPERGARMVLESLGIALETKAAQLDRKGRNVLLESLKHLPIGEVQHVPLEKGEVVAGGVCLDEVDPKTMASRLIAGLYLCGEILDVAGPVGGYNLQAAFATGYVGGESAAKAALAGRSG